MFGIFGDPGDVTRGEGGSGVITNEMPSPSRRTASLVFHRLIDSICLAQLVVLGHGALLSRAHLCEALRKVSLHNFEKADDS